MARSALVAAVSVPLLLLQLPMLAFAEECLSTDGSTCAQPQPQAAQGAALLQAHTQHNRGGAAAPAGHPDCPCLELSQTDMMEGGTFPERIYQKTINGEPHNFLPDCTDASREWYFPANLGIGGCTTFDGYAPFCGEGTAESPKKWTEPWMCQAKFCIVDPENCKSDWYIPGNLFPGMAFSYLTCDDKASATMTAGLEAATAILKKDHRAYHCAGGDVDDGLEDDAKEVQDTLGNAE